jgi:hypothetical protein
LERLLGAVMPRLFAGRDDEEVGEHTCVARTEEDVGRNSVASC